MIFQEYLENKKLKEGKNMKKIIVSIIAIGLLLTTSILSVNAYDISKDQRQDELSEYAIPMADIYVDDDAEPGGDGSYEQPFQKIQDGVDAASDGDKVFVFNGIYTKVEIKNSLKLIGESREDTIIITSYSGIYINSLDGGKGGVTISGFTITRNPNSSNGHFTGIYIKGANKNKIIDNAIVDAGLSEIEYSKCTGIRLFNSHENVVKGNIIKNLKSTWFTYGIDLFYSYNDTVTENTVEDIIAVHPLIPVYGVGISAQDSSFNNISENVVKNSNIAGISLVSSSGEPCRDNLVSGNVVINCLWGIYFQHQLHTVNNNTFCNNDISNHDIGIYLWIYSDSNTISSNKIHNNNIGIYLHGAEYNTITSNNISKNNYGIKLNHQIYGGIESGSLHTRYNTITKNKLIDNSLYGVLAQSKYVYSNNFYYNNFADNGGFMIGGNSRDKGSNFWDDGNEMGNYWDDYLGWDLNPRDGIGDIPYRIPPSSAGNKDNYPLMKPHDGSSQSSPTAKTSFFFFVQGLLSP
jgi:parallel beta-helix repeat protein